MDLLRLFARDKLLLGLFVLLAAGAWAPLFCTPLVPFVDLANNAAAACLLFDAQFGGGAASHYYEMNLAPVPYWTAYLLMALFDLVGGCLFAAKALVALLVVLLPLATMRLLMALGRDPRLGLMAFALVWDYSLYFGWVTFLLGMALTLVAIAWIVEARTFRHAARVVPLAALIALTHVQALGVLFGATALLTLLRRPFWKGVAVNATAVSGGLVALYPWFSKQVVDQAAGNSAYSFDWDQPRQKIVALFGHSLDTISGDPAQIVTAAVFWLVVLGPLVLASLPQREPSRPPRGRALALFALLFGLYALLPMNVHGPVWHTYTYPRFATFALLGLLLVPRPRLDGRWAWVLAPPVVAILLLDAVVAQQFTRFSYRARHFLTIIDAVRPGSRVLPLLYDDRDPAVRNTNVFNQFPAYLAAVKGGYHPYLFRHNSNPLLYRAANEPPFCRWNRPQDFSMHTHGRHYDYLLVQGTQRDPFVRSPSAQIRLVVEAGRWRLYEVTANAPTQTAAAP